MDILLQDARLHEYLHQRQTVRSVICMYDITSMKIEQGMTCMCCDLNTSSDTRKLSYICIAEPYVLRACTKGSEL